MAKLLSSHSNLVLRRTSLSVLLKQRQRQQCPVWHHRAWCEYPFALLRDLVYLECIPAMKSNRVHMPVDLPSGESGRLLRR